MEPARGLNRRSVRIAAMSLSSWLKRLLEPEKKLQSASASAPFGHQYFLGP
ncbi:MAG: hypothetical protein QOF42_1300 [Gammaproteobacteria bacterium]|nr:hypothetical protein [Gammaproteobacteria bacterium]